MSKKTKELNPFVLLTLMILIAAAASYIIPAGKFQRVADPASGKMQVVQGSFAYIEQTPVGLSDVVLAIPKGMEMSAIIIFWMFLAGGAFQVLEETGIVKSFLGWLIHKVRGKETLVIPFLMLAFALIGIPGINSPVIIFLPLMLLITRNLGFDPLVGMGMLYFGIYSTFNTAPISQTLLIVDRIGQLPIFSGAGFRSVICVSVVISAIVYVMWYAFKVKKNPKASLLYGHDIQYSFELPHDLAVKMTKRLWLVAIVSLISLVILVWGSIQYHWDFMELCGFFIVFTLAVSLAGGLKINQVADSFVKGMTDITGGALIIGFAFGIQYVLGKGNIIDTIIHNLANLLTGLAPTFAAIVMFFVNCVSAFLISSGSGQAGAVMPIMFPTGDLLGLTRQVTTQAFLFADGFMNGVTPTSGILMGALAIAKIPYGKWLRFHLPLLVIWIAIAIVSLFLGVQFGWK